MKSTIVVLAFLMSGAIVPAFGQATETESPEHEAARKNFETAKEALVNPVLVMQKQLATDEQTCIAWVNDHPTDWEERSFCNWRTNFLRDLSGKYFRLATKHKTQLESVDACVNTYHAIIDKKVSDFTQWEPDLVKACKALDIYPPPVTASETK